MSSERETNPVTPEQSADGKQMRERIAKEDSERITQESRDAIDKLNALLDRLESSSRPKNEKQDSSGSTQH